MKKKGFTLVELLACIAILSILMLVAVSSSLSALDKNRKQQYVVDAKRMMTLAESYMRKTTETNYPIGDEIYILYLPLLDDNTFENDPNGKEYINKMSYVTVTYKNNGSLYPYEYNVMLVGGTKENNTGVKLSNKVELETNGGVSRVEKNLKELTCAEISQKVLGKTSGKCIDVDKIDYKDREYIITFVSNGGSKVDTEIKRKNGEAYGSLPTATRIGYTFTGWYTEPTGGEKITATSIVSIRKNIELYAHWTANKYVVTLSPNGGNGSNQQVTVTYNDKYGSLPTFTKTGYHMSNYKTSASGGSSISSSTIVTTASNHTIYANWVPNTYTITYDLNGGKNSPSAPSSANYDSTITIPNPTKEDYHFIGWRITDMDSVTHYYGDLTTTSTSIEKTMATTFKNLKSTNGVVKFTATWTPKTCEDDIKYCKWVRVQPSEYFLNYFNSKGDLSSNAPRSKTYPVENIFDDSETTMWSSRSLTGSYCTSENSYTREIVVLRYSNVKVRGIAIKAGTSSASYNSSFGVFIYNNENDIKEKQYDFDSYSSSLVDGSDTNTTSLTSTKSTICCDYYKRPALSTSKPEGAWYQFDLGGYMELTSIAIVVYKTGGDSTTSRYVNVADIKLLK